MAVKVRWNFKKRHAANFENWSPKRIGSRANRVVLRCYLFLNPSLIIVAVSFFVTPLIFGDELEISDSIGFEQPELPFRNSNTLISHTFLESLWHQLSHGATRIGSTRSECPVIVWNTKKYIFYVFGSSSTKKSMMTSNQNFWRHIAGHSSFGLF